MTESEQQIPDLPPADELRMLEPGAVAMRTNTHRLEVRLGEDDWREGSLARLFPLSEPEAWIAVLAADGKERGVLRTLKGLSHDSLAAARDELRRRYLVPSILVIHGIRDRHDVSEWRVDTDRGPAVFQVRNFIDSAKTPVPGRLAITDVEGNRYDIPDINALDPDSRKRLDEQM
jgi:hypothetical protein